MIRKQLSSTVPKYKRIGIIGGVMVLGSMGALRYTAEHCWCFFSSSVFTAQFVSCRSTGKESEKTSVPADTFRQVTATFLQLELSYNRASA